MMRRSRAPGPKTPKAGTHYCIFCVGGGDYWGPRLACTYVLRSASGSILMILLFKHRPRLARLQLCARYNSPCRYNRHDANGSSRRQTNWRLVKDKAPLARMLRRLIRRRRRRRSRSCLLINCTLSAPTSREGEKMSLSTYAARSPWLARFATISAKPTADSHHMAGLDVRRQKWR